MGVELNLHNLLQEAFLPQGYPDSVSSDYLSYQLWDTTQAFCSSLTGTLATMAVLKGVGVGDSTATPLAATITWMLKDGTGMLGRIMFAWMCGSDLDCYSKQWRLVADILNDVAILLDLIAPMFPEVFLLIACIASVSRAVVGVAGSATRAAFVQHQARRNNMADVAAKDGSQETLVNLVGLIVNLIVTPMIAKSQLLIWIMFVVFTTLHLWANYRAVSVLCMDTLNKNRLHIVIEHYLRTGAVLSPQEANVLEPILTRVERKLTFDLGSCLSEALKSADDYESIVMEVANSNRDYVFVFAHSRRKVSICLGEDCDRGDHLKAALIVEFADYIQTSGMSGPVLNVSRDNANIQADDVLRRAQLIVDHVHPQLLTSLTNMGWMTDHVLLGAGEWRYTRLNN